MIHRFVVRALAALAIASTAGCSGVTETYEAIQGPPFGTDGATFAPVSAVMEARCGTLDCHGQISRPLRIFGQQGLRMPLADGGMPPGYTTNGTIATTPEELLSNYGAACGLEPEILSRVVAHKDPPENLTLIRKPRLTERHKGGQIWYQNDPGDKCLVKWVTGKKSPDTHELDTSDCLTELQHL